MQLKRITSVKKAVKLLGGVSATARTLECAPSSVVNWSRKDQIASPWYHRAKAALAARGHSIDDDFFDFLPVLRDRAQAA